MIEFCSGRGLLGATVAAIFDTFVCTVDLDPGVDPDYAMSVVDFIKSPASSSTRRARNAPITETASVAQQTRRRNAVAESRAADVSSGRGASVRAVLCELQAH